MGMLGQGHKHGQGMGLVWPRPPNRSFFLIFSWQINNMVLWLLTLKPHHWLTLGTLVQLEKSNNRHPPPPLSTLYHYYSSYSYLTLNDINITILYLPPSLTSSSSPTSIPLLHLSLIVLPLNQPHSFRHQLHHIKGDRYEPL